jgi:hypothetical protein
VGGDRVHGTSQTVISDRPQEDAQQVVKIDPAHELLAAAERTPQSEPEHREESGKQTATSGKHDSEARQNDPDAGGRGRRGCLLPGPANSSQEAFTRR